MTKKGEHPLRGDEMETTILILGLSGILLTGAIALTALIEITREKSK